MQRISGETLCFACQYDLDGLDTSGRCPECGARIADTLAFQQGTVVPTPWTAGQRVLRAIVIGGVLGFAAANTPLPRMLARTGWWPECPSFINPPLILVLGVVVVAHSGVVLLAWRSPRVEDRTWGVLAWTILGFALLVLLCMCGSWEIR